MTDAGFLSLTPQLAAAHWGWTIAFFLWFIGLSGMLMALFYFVRDKRIALVSFVASILGCVFVPVSYTHLDVYKRQMKEEALRHSLSEIEKAGEEADAIVDRVRNFVKGKESAHVPLDLTAEVNRTVETFRRHTDSPITVSYTHLATGKYQNFNMGVNEKGLALGLSTACLLYTSSPRRRVCAYAQEADSSAPSISSA